MKKIVIAPDSFKGTLSSVEVAEVLAKAARERYPSAEIITLPIADGGEGSLECFESFKGGERVSITINNPFMEEIKGEYLILPGGKTAVIESAKAIGLNLAGDRKNPMLTTTFGVGELIKSALDKGVKEIILAIGGSSTNDGGIGMAVALGLKAYNKQGKEFLPAGGTLVDIERLDFKGLDSRINKTLFTVMCDVENLPFGELGATYVYAKQKGGLPEYMGVLESGIKKLEQVIFQSTGKRYHDLVGGGAAGGLGMGAKAFLNARLQKGIEVVLSLSGFEKIIKGASLVITGEGKLDAQSLMGKVVSGIAKRTMEQKVKLAVVAGVNELSQKEGEKWGISYIFSTNPKNLPFEKVRDTAREDLVSLSKKIFDEIAI